MLFLITDVELGKTKARRKAPPSTFYLRPLGYKRLESDEEYIPATSSGKFMLTLCQGTDEILL